MPGPAPRPDDAEFRQLAPWPAGIRFLNSRTERILQGQLPYHPDHPARTLIGGCASAAADHPLAERDMREISAAEATSRRARDAARQRARRAAAWA